MVHPEAIPLNQVLPVFLKVLPLKEYNEESLAVYGCISTLVLSSNPQVNETLSLLRQERIDLTFYLKLTSLLLGSHYITSQIIASTPDLVRIFAAVAISPDETPEVKVQIGRAFSHLFSLCGQQMQPILSSLSPAHANALAALSPRS